MDNNNQGKENVIQLNIKDFWARLWQLIQPSHRQIFSVLGLIMIVEAVRLIGPYILKLIIDQLSNFSQQDVPWVIFLLVGMFFANEIVSWIMYFVDRRSFGIIAEIEKYLSDNALRKMVFLDLGYHEKENTGNKIIKIQRGTDKIIELLANTFWEVMPTTLQVIFTAVVLFLIDWRFGFILLTFVPVFIYLTLQINKIVYPLRRKRYDEQEQAGGLMAQSIININTVKSFVQERRESRRHERIREKIKNILLVERKSFLKANLKRFFVIDLGRLLVLVLGAYWVWQENMTLGSLVFVFTISEKSLISLFRISRLYDRIMESGEAVERLYDLSLEEPDIKNPKRGYVPRKITGEIEFKHVSFSYSESDVKALDDVSVKIQSGCMTALVGPSGGGKTTLVRLLYRHYDPESGQVLLDERDLKTYDLYAFRKFYAIVPQDVEIFDASIRDNIAYAKPEASMQEIVAAAKIANAEEFITQMKEGYETLVGERGIKLSGGQRQRIGIARAILANPKILIFDEATSSLDSYSEKLIQDALDRISKGRTVIVIAHRLSTIRKADKIIVLEDGKVAETGNHIQLANNKGGLYKRLLRLQQTGYVE